MTRLELRFLGGLTLHQAGRPLTALKSQKGQALLCYLALTGKAHPRPVLAGLFWPEKLEEDALGNLRKVLQKLKPDLDSHLTITTQSIAFNQDAPYWLDVAEFEAGLTAKGDIGRLQAAIALYQGDFLEGFYLDDAPEFEGWVLRQRAHLRQAALGALQHLVAHFAGRGIYETAVTYARQLLTIEPWQEEAHRELMHLLALSGQRSAALAQYEACRQLLQDELDVEPSAEMQALYEAIRAGQLHKEAVDTEQVKELLPPPRPATNLPARLTSFIGRRRELAEIRTLLEKNRLVTLTGPGGTGKTRLSLEVAGTLLDAFPDGIWLVELAPLADPAFVVNAIAAVFELREEGERPLASVLTDYLQAKQLLLILDNCEHLIESCARLAESWLETCPKLTILASSREALGVPGEIAVRIPPLAVPDRQQSMPLETLAEIEAVQLFVERARASLPDFGLTEQNGTAVSQVCQRLDGIPLALELAAARVKVLKVEQIAQRLDDRFRLLTGGSRTALPRQQTLRATLDWSYDLLPEAEQQLLQRLAVFAGGWTLEAAEAVCAEKEESGTEKEEMRNEKKEALPSHFSFLTSFEILDLLSQLVNKSLVLAEREPGQESRYRLLETIRQYAQEKLLQAGNGETFRNRHLDYFLQLAETAEPRLRRTEQILWLDRLEAEYDNLRVALAWSLENPNGDVESGLRLATALVDFWLIRSHFREARRWLDVALEKRNSAAPPVRARLLLNVGLLWFQRRVDPTALLQESEALCRQLDDNRGVAGCLMALGLCALNEGELVVATSLLSEGLTLARQFDDKQLLTDLYYGLAGVALQKGDFVQVTELIARGLALAQETGDRDMKFHLLLIQGRSAYAQRDHAQARAFFLEALALSRELKYRRIEGVTLTSLGEIARVERAYAEAVVFYHESLSLAREEGNMSSVAIVLNNLGLVALRQGDRPQATSLFRESMALTQEMKMKNISLWNVYGLARVALAEGQTQRAAQLLAADGLLAEIKRFDPFDFDDYERDVALACAQLGEEAFATAWAEGEGMTLDEAVAYALQEK